MSKLTDSNPYISLMSHLIALGLIRKMSGEHQLEVAQKILDTVNLEQLSGIDALSQEENTHEVCPVKNFFDFTLTKCPVIYQFMVREVHELYDFKTEQQDCIGLCTDHNCRRYLSDSQTCSSMSQLADRNESCMTVYLLYILSLLILVTFQIPLNRGHYYVHLMRKIYHLANVSTTLPNLSSRLLQALFFNFKEDALVFLAGIWSTSDAEVLKESRSIALLHAAAFLEAHILEDDGMDFQTILPLFLVALQEPDAKICQGALECISRIRILSDRKLSLVYRFDTVYGESERE